MTPTERADEVLEEEECLRLLGWAGIGRVAYSLGALPAVGPVSYTMADHSVLIPTRAEDPLAHAARGAVLALGVDGYDSSTDSGWSVTVVGPAYVAPTGVAPDGAPGVDCLIVVQARLITGRRTTLPAWRPEPGDSRPARS